MTDFLLELLCEEIPARMQDNARQDLKRLFAAELAKAGLRADDIATYATPRRLALIAYGLPHATQAIAEEFKGPRTSAPDQAVDGFLRKTGLTRDQLEDRDGVWFATVERPGRATADVLAEAIPAIIRAFPWPKSMRWGAASRSTESLRWVRPLQGIVALLGSEVVPVAIDGLGSGRETAGHRFHASGPVTIADAASYERALRDAKVIVDQEERRQRIVAGAMQAAEAAGLVVVPDPGLVDENAGLTEWPVPLLGRFDPAFLEVPPEVIQLTLRVNQKYFVLRDAQGRLANAFICVANVEARDGGAAIVAGNGKVLAARLSDARFFWDQDRKTPLAVHAEKLARITFHEKLGTVADKVDRVAKLARWLVEEGVVRGADPDLAEQAARLAKADLVTDMVGEFPELQGVMGGYYARAEGLPDEVADAIRDHYKPVGQGDEVPTAPVTVAVALADKLDSIIQFFGEGMIPSGSSDQFALRRSALAVIALLVAQSLRLKIRDLASACVLVGSLRKTYLKRDEKSGAFFPMAAEEAQASRSAKLGNVFSQVIAFFADRLKVQQREAGVRHDLIDAVFALGGEDDLVRLLARVKALQAFVGTEDGANLLAGYKRAANILRKEGWGDAPTPPAGTSGAQGIPQTGEEDPLVLVDDPVVADALAGHEALVALGYDPEPAEAALIAALDAAAPRAGAAVAAEDFEGAMAALATLRAPIDAFFDAVTVNDPDPARRAARLGLLARIRDAVHKVADFSRIEG